MQKMQSASVLRLIRDEEKEREMDWRRRRADSVEEEEGGKASGAKPRTRSLIGPHDNP